MIPKPKLSALKHSAPSDGTISENAALNSGSCVTHGAMNSVCFSQSFPNSWHDRSRGILGLRLGRNQRGHQKENYTVGKRGIASRPSTQDHARSRLVNLLTSSLREIDHNCNISAVRIACGPIFPTRPYALVALVAQFRCYAVRGVEACPINHGIVIYHD